MGSTVKYKDWARKQGNRKARRYKRPRVQKGKESTTNSVIRTRSSFTLWKKKKCLDKASRGGMGFDPSIYQIEVGGTLWVWSHPGLHKSSRPAKRCIVRSYLVSGFVFYAFWQFGFTEMMPLEVVSELSLKISRFFQSKAVRERWRQ